LPVAQLERSDSAAGHLEFKVGKKGGISAYDLGRLPVTLCYKQRCGFRYYSGFFSDFSSGFSGSFIADRNPRIASPKLFPKAPSLLGPNTSSAMNRISKRSGMPILASMVSFRLNITFYLC
jgi:hypothetical protein